jgi:hypothetical protein
MKYFDCWLRRIDKKEYARIQQRKELYEKGLGKVFVFLDVDGVLNVNQTDDDFTYVTSSTIWKIRNNVLKWITSLTYNLFGYQLGKMSVMKLTKR